jgi:hypothetical protein
MADQPRELASSWVAMLLSALDAEVDRETRRRILARCAQDCTGYWAGVAAEVRSSAETSDVDALLARFVERLPGGADLARDGDLIRWRFTGPSCPCPIARLAPHPGICDCSVAHVRGMLEPLLGRPLGVELLWSRLRGAEDCLFVVKL